MNQSNVNKLVSKLRFKLHNRRKLRNVQGPLGRHNKIRKTVTALFKHERIELNYGRADESRGYAERLISDAIRYGECHKETMQMASYWLLEKQLVHKLFKVLVPRYQNCQLSYTKMWRAPKTYPGTTLPKCVLELRYNVYPNLGPDKEYNKNLIHNVLLLEAKKVYEQEKALKSVKESGEEEMSKAAAAAAAESVGEEQLVVQESLGEENLEMASKQAKDADVGGEEEMSKAAATESTGEELLTGEDGSKSIGKTESLAESLGEENLEMASKQVKDVDSDKTKEVETEVPIVDSDTKDIGFDKLKITETEQKDTPAKDGENK